MSGPKTSEISIEERIQQRLSAANALISSALSTANCGLSKSKDNIASIERSFKAMGGAENAESIIRSSNQELTSAQSKLEALRLAQTSMRSMSSIDNIDAEAERIAAEARAIAEQAAQDLAAKERELQDMLQRAERISAASDFAAMLKGVLASEHGDMVEQGAEERSHDTSVNAASTPKLSEITCWEDIADTVGDAASRYANLMSQPEYMTSKSASIMVRHGAQLLAAIEQCSEDPSASDLTAASNSANTMLELLPACEREAEALREIRSQLEALDDADKPSFATLDEAEEYLSAMKTEHAEESRQDYIRSCIDDVMRRHGYDIARSVTLGRSTTGEHIVFGSSTEQDGVHVFMTDEGDMMMEAVGASDVSSISQDADVDIDHVIDASKADELVGLQEAFCSVYAEIESDLAEYGIRINTVHRCAPSVEYSKQLHIASSGEQAGNASPAKAASTRDAARRRRRASGNRERAL